MLALPLVGAVPANVMACQAGLSDGQVHALDSAVRAYMTAQGIPGLSLAIGDRGRQVYAKGFGLADLESHKVVTPLTIFGAASSVKNLTATAILQLADGGRLDLTAPIQRYCPAFPAKRWVVTAAQLLGHQGGVEPSVGADVFRRDHYISVTEAVHAFAADSLRYEPGTATVYSNYGYVLLACAIEGASGQPYDAYVRERILIPAHMLHTQRNNVYEVIPNRARSYLMRTEVNTKQLEGLWTPAQLALTKVGVPSVADQIDPSYAWGAGNYLSTPSDMVRFVIALEGKRLVSQRVLAQEFASHPTADGKPDGRGWDWVVDEEHGERVGQVLGSDWSTSFGVLTLPAHQFTIAIASNIQFDQPSSLTTRIAQICGYMTAP